MLPTRRATQNETHEDPDEALLAGSHNLEVPLRAREILAFRTYREEILRWNARTNLTAFATAMEIVRQGFLDSLACVPLLPANTRRIVDIGSGAGFPAIPIAIVRPDLRIDLVESSRRRTSFLRHIVRLLNLRGASVRLNRSDDLLRGNEMLGEFDVALARAVAPLAQLGPRILPFLKPGGVFLAQVGSGADVAEAADSLGRTGFVLRGETRVSERLGVPGRRILALERRDAQ